MRSSPRVLTDYLRRQAQERPDEVGVVLGDERWTFGELEAASNRLARVLLDLQCEPGDRVCLFAPKLPRAILAMHAVLKAGCAYVPIDVASPAQRVEKILLASRPRALLITKEATGLVDDLVARGELPGDLKIGSLDDQDIVGPSFRTSFATAEWARHSSDPLDLESSPDDIAHLLFTSGSTGDPKGVAITHSNVIHFVEWAVGYFGIDSSDRNSGHPPLHFDLSTFDIYGAMASGAQLHLVSATSNLLPHQLTAFIRDAELTQWFSVPSAMTFMAKHDAVPDEGFPSLRRVLWCGEVLPVPTLIHWMERLPGVQFTNLYGPTEATIASSYYTVPEIPPDPAEPTPIGVPCAGEELLVLDDELLEVPQGEIGNLYIGGVGLSPGYWEDEAKTSAAFIADPRDPASRIYKTGDLATTRDDGLVVFLGRADSQIKSRGHRIELGEIETALNALENLRDSAVVAVEVDGFEGVAICCAYAPASGDVGPSELRRDLRSSLPSYMLPTRWLGLDELPKNVNGKIDRRRLKELFAEGADRKPARSGSGARS
jgi:amino acid adenylation domain-containing protein